MQIAYNTQAPKRAANLSVNDDLLKQARALNINLSATLEEGLIAKIQILQQAAWLAQNQAAIVEYNQQVDTEGTFGDSLRAF
ncbi:MAG TPA: type II toxin-antitoxin system CcdA family antitoxin [Rugosibacter sp.]|nr:type II toxin-antitoxin system CcdA family antitoxin [Methylophilus sp.]HQQ35936.1 type II toxin-antitoxin system CcdA family antitoxin [Rugosibacter sp.]